MSPGFESVCAPEEQSASAVGPLRAPRMRFAHADARRTIGRAAGFFVFARSAAAAAAGADTCVGGRRAPADVAANASTTSASPKTSVRERRLIIDSPPFERLNAGAETSPHSEPTAPAPLCKRSSRKLNAFSL